MMPIVQALLGFVVGIFRSRIALQLEIVALRHQLGVYRRSIRRPVQPPNQGRVFAVPEVDGLHHHYERKAA